MSDQRLKHLYQTMLTRRAQAGGECGVAPETMADVLQGRVTGTERERILLAVMSDSRCREEFELLRAVVAAAPDAAAPGVRRYAAPLALAAALALLLGAGLWWRGPASGGDPLRDDGGEPLVRVISPVASPRSETPLLFAWHAAPDALRYSFDLLTSDGAVVYSVTVTDTVLRLPDSVALEPERDYRWWVEARLTTGERRRSAIRRLRITSP